MASLDLDKKRAARNTDPHAVVLGGETFEWPAQLPILFTDLMSEGKIGAAVRLVLGDEQGAAFLEHGLTVEDISDIAEELYATPSPTR